MKKNETTRPPDGKAELGLRAGGACSVGDGVLEKRKEDYADGDSEVSSEFGACLDDSESRDFVRDSMVHEQVKGFGESENAPANKAMQFRAEKGSSCVSEPQVGPRLDAPVG